MGNIYVYLICSESENNKIYKIGFTKRTIEKRLKEFKTGNASELYLVNSFKSEYGVKIESSLKRRFKKYNISGEWFALPENVINDFKLICAQIHENYEFISKHSTL